MTGTAELVEPIPAIGYIRVSMAREEMISPALQRTAIQAWADRSNRRIVRWIEDLDQTGRNFKRRVMEAIAAVEAGQASEIAVWKFSRFGRNRLGWAVNLDRVETAGGALQSATEEVDARTATGRFARGMLAEVAAFESERIGEGWREVHARRVKMGLPATGKPRWGYTYDKSAGFTPDPVLGEVLADLYRRYTAGESAESLVEWLNVQGIATTTGHTFQVRTLLRMLDTGFGAGRLNRHDPKATCSRASGRCAQPAHFEHLDGAHLAVITDVEWRAYQRARAGRSRVPSRTKGSVYPFSGLVRCRRCTGPMYPGQYGHDRKPKYRCATRARSGPSACTGGYVMAHYLEQCFRNWLDELVSDVDRLMELTQPRPASVAARVDSQRVEKQIEALDEALTQLTVNLAMKVITDQAYVAARDRIGEQRAELAARLADDLETVRELPRPGPDVYIGLAREWDLMDAAKRRDGCRSIIAGIDVLTGRPRAQVEVVPRWVG